MRKIKRRKVKKTVQLTDNSREYKMTKRKDNTLHCSICPPHRGCNRNWNLDRNWKKYRKTQWRE